MQDKWSQKSKVADVYHKPWHFLKPEEKNTFLKWQSLFIFPGKDSLLNQAMQAGTPALCGGLAESHGPLQEPVSLHSLQSCNVRSTQCCLLHRDEFHPARFLNKEGGTRRTTRLILRYSIVFNANEICSTHLQEETIQSKTVLSSLIYPSWWEMKQCITEAEN